MKPPTILLTDFSIALAGCPAASVSCKATPLKHLDNAYAGSVYCTYYNRKTSTGSTYGSIPSCPGGNCGMQFPDGNYSAYPPRGTYCPIGIYMTTIRPLGTSIPYNRGV